MCCFSRPVKHVAKTKIFARGEGGGAEARQFLAYAMNVEVDEELAMVLPLPVPPRSAEDAVRFIDLEGYDSFFADLERAFPPILFLQPAGRGAFGLQQQEAPKLVVHDVGRFEASFVPTRADFSRLDARFRLPDGVWDRLTAYADWGFAVFRLKPVKGMLGLRTKEQSVHPMAFSFPRRDPRSLFFPTLHIHDGHVSEKALFDHALYAQLDGLIGQTIGWTASQGTLAAYVDGARARGLVDGTRGAHATQVAGELRNDDVWLREPEGITTADLHGRGPLHAHRLCTRSAYAITFAHDMEPTWKETAQRRAGALARALQTDLPAMLERNRQRWRLAELTDALPAHFMNGQQLWTGTTYMDGAPVKTFGPGRVRFTPFTKLVESQDITIGFAQVPDADTLSEIQTSLRALLDRAVSSDRPAAP